VAQAALGSVGSTRSLLVALEFVGGVESRNKVAPRSPDYRIVRFRVSNPSIDIFRSRAQS
jgi:hypothetical protein